MFIVVFETTERISYLDISKGEITIIIRFLYSNKAHTWTWWNAYLLTFCDSFKHSFLENESFTNEMKELSKYYTNLLKR